MLAGIYSRGHVSKTVCARDRLKTFLQHCRHNGHHLSFIESPKEGVIIPSQSQKLQNVIDSGSLVVLKSKRCSNIIVVGKYGKHKNSVDNLGDIDKLGNMYEYHIVHITNMTRPVPAQGRKHSVLPR